MSIQAPPSPEAVPGLAPPFDEWAHGDAALSASVNQLRGFFSGQGSETLDGLVKLSRRQMRDQGIAYGIGLEEEPRHSDAAFPFDLVPLPLSPAEWAGLSAGIVQRVRTWNAFLQDIFAGQEILRAGVVPFEIVYADPHFHRQCVGIPMPRDVFVHLAAVDLVRGPDGGWRVMEDNISNPSGASYALQNRRVLSQVCPQVFQNQPVRSVYNFPHHLLETLQAAAPSSIAAARVVALSPELDHPGYFDHGAMARQMGIPLVQGSDLIVLDSELYLKTIGGLERIDVLYRRVEGTQLDPVAFGQKTKVGIPGLVSCLRKGTLTVANALGAGLGDNRALAAYLPAMMDFYFNEQPLLPSLPCHHLADVDQREQVDENWSQFVFKATSSRDRDSVWMGETMDDSSWKALRKRIEAAPSNFIAQPRLNFSTAPSCVGGRLEDRHVSLRTFVLNDGEPRAVPLVLTRVSAREDSLLVSSVSGGSSKDTWVLKGEEPEEKRRPVALAQRYQPRRMHLASRSAEAIYWTARYAERVEATVRILRVVQQLSLEAASPENAPTWAPLWEALASATGHPTQFFKRRSFQEQRGMDLARYILLEDASESSAISSLRKCRRNAQLVRETLPPEVWAVINRTYLHLALCVEEQLSPRVQGMLQDLSLHDELQTQLDELAGAVQKHMLHNDAWHFWRIGRSSESAFFTLISARQVFSKRTDEQIGHFVAQDGNLEALLRMMSAQYAYRSSYRSRPTASQVALLLLRDEEFPRSVVYCLNEIDEAFRDMFGQRPPTLAEVPMRSAGRLLSEVRYADLGRYFNVMEEGYGAGIEPDGGQRGVKPRATRMRSLADWLGRIVRKLGGLGTRISDHCFEHQGGSRRDLPNT